MPLDIGDTVFLFELDTHIFHLFIYRRMMNINASISYNDLASFLFSTDSEGISRTLR
jgi:hypothetical protein